MKIFELNQTIWQGTGNRVESLLVYAFLTLIAYLIQVHTAIVTAKVVRTGTVSLSGFIGSNKT